MSSTGTSGLEPQDAVVPRDVRQDTPPGEARLLVLDSRLACAADAGCRPARWPPASSGGRRVDRGFNADRKSTRLNSSHVESSYAVFCLKKKKIATYELTTEKKNTSDDLRHAEKRVY